MPKTSCVKSNQACFNDLHNKCKHVFKDYTQSHVQLFNPSENCIILQPFKGLKMKSFNHLKCCKGNPSTLKDSVCRASKGWRTTCSPPNLRRIEMKSFNPSNDYIESFNPSKDSKRITILQSFEGLNIISHVVLQTFEGLQMQSFSPLNDCNVNPSTLKDCTCNP